jgi:hypothetical protein
VDTHPIHFHLFNIQLLNRVTWDNIIIPPEPTELGWKETVRVSPLEDTIVVVRPIVPTIPFGVPDSKRPLNPSMPLGARGDQNGPNGTQAGFNNTDINGNPIAPIINSIVSFGWEYVFHCHILSHEEMDMMRPMVVHVPSVVPDAPVLTSTGSNPVNLTWTDGTPVTSSPATWGSPKAEIGYRIEKAVGTGAFVTLGKQLANKVTFSDATVDILQDNSYRVVAYNQAGETVSNTITVVSPYPKAPTNLVATLSVVPVTLAPRVTLTFTDRSTNETRFVVDRSTNGGTTWTLNYANINPKAGSGTSVSYNDTAVVMGTTYTYRVKAVNGTFSSGYSNTATVLVALPGAPTNFTVSAARNGTTDRVTLSWTPTAPLNQSTFTIQRATDAAFTVNRTTFTVTGTTTSLTQTGLARGLNLYYRIRADNPLGSSNWVNANPFPILMP